MKTLRRWMRRRFGPHATRERVVGEDALAQMEALDEPLRRESDEGLRRRAAALRERARAGAAPDDLLVECYALVREVAARTVGLRPFDVQVLGAVAMHRGNVVEMKTGEGKTLAATLPAALHALSGRGVHVVTVNDYLAARDAETMGPLYRFLGLSVGAVTEEIDPETRRAERRAGYAADVTYVSNDELVFDYLRDQLAAHRDEQVLRPLHFALVDELDLILLDEAGTPLIISGPSGDEPAFVREAREAVAPLRPGEHFTVDRRTRRVSTKEAGWAAVERALGVDDLTRPEELRRLHAVQNALLAHAVYERDVDYIVQDGRVLLVDPHTGRVSPDKRLADGLHQALEAKEGVLVRSEDRTLARTTYQCFFRRYPRLCGMTGTAVSAAGELGRTYGLRVVPIPTHRPMIRRDHPAVVFRSGREKLAAVAAEIERLRAAGRPVLVGTTSVRESERLSALLAERGVPHHVLNAKNHRAEAAIIAQAGREGAVTLSTNMAGRGVDIRLGGDPPDPAEQARVVAAGGLAVIGTGLHESRRIDDQLRGRAGRQGDPGTSRFFLSLDDPIYRRFGDVIEGVSALERLREALADHPRGEPVTAPRVLDTLTELRRKVEVEEQAIRREVLKYDLVIEEQRARIYGWRDTLLDPDPTGARRLVEQFAEAAGDDLVGRHLDPDRPATAGGLARLAAEARARFGVDLPVAEGGRIAPEDVAAHLGAALRARLAALDLEAHAELARQVLLDTIDDAWTDHLTHLERIDDATGLYGYGGEDPLVSFRREAGLAFGELLVRIRLDTLERLLADLEPPDGERVPPTPGTRRARPVRYKAKR